MYLKAIFRKDYKNGTVCSVFGKETESNLYEYIAIFNQECLSFAIKSLKQYGFVLKVYHNKKFVCTMYIDEFEREMGADLCIL